jgi:hypothetical protein
MKLEKLKEDLTALKRSYEMMLRIPDVEQLPLKFEKVYDVILYEGKSRIDIRVAGKKSNGKVNNKTIKSWKKEKGRYLIMPITEYIYIYRLIRSIDRFLEVSPFADCSADDYTGCVDEIKKKLLKRKGEIESLLGFDVDFDKYADVWLYKAEYKDGIYIQLRANAYNGSRKVAVKVPEDKANILQEYVSVYRALKRLNKVEKLLLSVVDLIRDK